MIAGSGQLSTMSVNSPNAIWPASARIAAGTGDSDETGRHKAKARSIAS
jgi:hypothetical protein